MKRERIAIIGTGISGLSCAHTLCREHDVTLYEAADYIGGHTRTVRVEVDGEISDIDTGFIVFNDRTYPLFMGLMDSLGVAYQPTEMSFSVRNDDADLEYNGHNLNTLFSQRRNLVRPAFLRMVREILRFNKEVRASANRDSQQTIGDFLVSGKYSELFIENYLLPMISAIWSMGLQSSMDFPLQFFVRFFENHGLLDIANRPQWYTIKGGSSSYIEPLTRAFAGQIRLNSPVLKVMRYQEQVQLVTADGMDSYDQVVFACHANQALTMIDEPTGDELGVLSKLTTSDNRVVLHTDTSFLPKRKGCWASWNYNMVNRAEECSTLTYDMNILQRLNKQHTYLVTLNQDIPEDKILGVYNYSHPVYSLEAIEAQDKWSRISGKNRSHFCGAYWFNGFHEDGVKSGLRAAQSIGGTQ